MEKVNRPTLHVVGLIMHLELMDNMSSLRGGKSHVLPSKFPAKKRDKGDFAEKKVNKLTVRK